MRCSRAVLVGRRSLLQYGDQPWLFAQSFSRLSDLEGSSGGHLDVKSYKFLTLILVLISVDC